MALRVLVADQLSESLFSVLTARGAHVDLRLVRDLHAMLLRPGRWHRAVARFAAAAIRDANSADRPN